MREYFNHEDSWHRFCGVYDSIEAVHAGRDQIIHEKLDSDDAIFVIYETDMNEVVYLDDDNKAMTREEREKARIDLKNERFKNEETSRIYWEARRTFKPQIDPNLGPHTRQKLYEEQWKTHLENFRLS
jgi:hypothetical protein